MGNVGIRIEHGRKHEFQTDMLQVHKTGFEKNNLFLKSQLCVRNVGQTNYNADGVELIPVQFPDPKIMTTQGFLERFLSRRKPGQHAHCAIPLCGTP